MSVFSFVSFASFCNLVRWRWAFHPAQVMSAQEIIAELPKLSQPELLSLGNQINALLARAEGRSPRSWGEALMEVAGSVPGLPADFAQHHDYYLHGAPKP